MTKFQKISLFLLRIGLGWFMFYAGITKVLNPSWSASGYLMGAKTLPSFFAWFAQPHILPVTNFLNEWGLTILGVSLILGIFVRITSLFGILLMLLYYVSGVFPNITASAFVVDQHIIFILVLLYFAAIRAGRVYGLENWCSNLPICSKFPKLRNWLG